MKTWKNPAAPVYKASFEAIFLGKKFLVAVDFLVLYALIFLDPLPRPAQNFLKLKEAIGMD